MIEMNNKTLSEGNAEIPISSGGFTKAWLDHERSVHLHEYTGSVLHDRLMEEHKKSPRSNSHPHFLISLHISKSAFVSFDFVRILIK